LTKTKRKKERVCVNTSIIPCFCHHFMTMMQRRYT
jgi:hypothetical protein